MFADWSCTVLVHNRTCYGKYRILQVLIDLCNSLISGSYFTPFCYVRGQRISWFKKGMSSSPGDELDTLGTIFKQLRFIDFQETLLKKLKSLTYRGTHEKMRIQRRLYGNHYCFLYSKLPATLNLFLCPSNRNAAERLDFRKFNSKSFRSSS